MTWGAFARAAPDLAGRGDRLLRQYGGMMAYLATASSGGRVRIHPVCPVPANDRLYLFVLGGSPKKRDLIKNGCFALHAFPRPVGAKSFDDEEFMLFGRAVSVTDQSERESVAQAALDDWSDDDALFELRIECAMHKCRNANGAPVYSTWRTEPPANE